MTRFFRERGLALAIVIGVSVIISLLQGGMSYSVLLGALRDRFNIDAPLLASLHWLGRAGTPDPSWNALDVAAKARPVPRHHRRQCILHGYPAKRCRVFTCGAEQR